MAERATIFEGIQVGVEAANAPGVAVAADKKLTSVSISPGPQLDTNQFKPHGVKFTTLSVPNREWIEADLAGVPTYDEIIWPLGSAVTKPSPSTPSGATNARRWVFSSAVSGPDAPLTMTVEAGSSLRAHRFANGLVNSLQLEFSRSGISMSGSMIGQALVDGITMTGSPTAFPLVPVLPTQVDVFLDSTQAGIGSTKLTRAFTVTWALSDRFGQVWPLNSSVASWATHIETEPSLQVTLRMEADSTGMGLLPTLRAGDTKWMRVEAKGTAIDTLSPVNISSSTNASPIVVTTSGAHNLSDGDVVTIASHATNTAANGRWTVNVTGASTFKLLGSTGNGIGGATGTVTPEYPYLLRLDQPVKLTDTDGFDDEDGVQVIQWSAAGVYDATWGKAFEWTVQNTQSSY